jgi:hypothetical protein
MFLGLWTEGPTEQELACAEYHEIFEAEETAKQEAQKQGE